MVTKTIEVEFQLINESSFEALSTHPSINYSQLPNNLYHYLEPTTLSTENFTINNFNHSANLTDLSTEPSCAIFLIVHYGVIGSILVILGLIGNTLSFCIFSKDKVKTSTVFLFQSLAVVDNILLLAVVPIFIIPTFFQLMSDIVYDIFDVIIFPIAMLAQTVTVWLTVLVAFNRYLAVCKPYKAASLCTVKQAKCQLAVVVFFSVVFNLPRFFQFTLVLLVRPNNTTYYEIKAREFYSSQIYINVYETALYFIVMLFLPLLVLNILNVKLVKALKELKRKRVDMVQNARQKNDNNVTLVLIIVVVVFVICQVPALFNRLLWNILPDSSRKCDRLHFYVQVYSNISVFTNSSINFVIYMAFNPRFRQTVVESSCCAPILVCFRKNKLQKSGVVRLNINTKGPNSYNFKCLKCCNKLIKPSINDVTTNTKLSTKNHVPNQSNKNSEPFLNINHKSEKNIINISINKNYLGTSNANTNDNEISYENISPNKIKDNKDENKQTINLHCELEDKKENNFNIKNGKNKHDLVNITNEEIAISNTGTKENKTIQTAKNEGNKDDAKCETSYVTDHLNGKTDQIQFISEKNKIVIIRDQEEKTFKNEIDEKSTKNYNEIKTHDHPKNIINYNKNNNDIKNNSEKVSKYSHQNGSNNKGQSNNTYGVNNDDEWINKRCNNILKERQKQPPNDGKVLLPPPPSGPSFSYSSSSSSSKILDLIELKDVASNVNEEAGVNGTLVAEVGVINNNFNSNFDNDSSQRSENNFKIN